MEHLGLERSIDCHPWLEGWVVADSDHYGGIYFLIEDPELRALDIWKDGPAGKWAKSDDLSFLDSFGLLFIKAY